MLKDHIEKYYFPGNYNCAETILRAANDYYELGLSEKEMKLVAAYGAGMQTGNVCGALLAGMAIFSLRYVEAKAHESADIKPAAALLTRRFRETMGGSILCKEIKPQFFQKEIRCLHTVETACDVIEQVVLEYEAQNSALSQ